MVGIVILNYNSWDDVELCIHSIDKSEKSLDYQIYVVDNNSPKRPTEGYLQNLRDNKINFIQNSINSGYSSGNNIGIKEALRAGCDAILISNSDVRYENESITKLYLYLKGHPEVGIVGPKIIREDGSLQKECMMTKTGPKEKYLLRTRLNVLCPKFNRKYWGRNHDYDVETFKVYAVLGCSFMISRACALQVTPLDEVPFLYEEELILGIRMEQNGWDTVYLPDSKIMHLHGKSTGSVKPFAYTCNVSSEIYYCKKYLKMKNWQIIPLYLYRSILFMIKFPFDGTDIGRYFKQTISKLKTDYGRR